MNRITPADIRVFLKDYVNRKMESAGRAAFADLPDDCDLLLSGIIDSIGLLDLVAALQNFAGCEIDFELLDPEEMTIVGPLCRFVSDSVSQPV